jgi:hypothetical protein
MTRNVQVLQQDYRMVYKADSRRPIENVYFCVFYRSGLTIEYTKMCTREMFWQILVYVKYRKCVISLFGGQRIYVVILEVYLTYNTHSVYNIIGSEVYF